MPVRAMSIPKHQQCTYPGCGKYWSWNLGNTGFTNKHKLCHAHVQQAMKKITEWIEKGV